MSDIEAQTKELLDKRPPVYRMAYSDRIAWIMACMSEFAYIKFNQPMKGSNLVDILDKLLHKKDNSNIGNAVTKLKALYSYDPAEEKAKLERELETFKYELINTIDVGDTQAILVSNIDHAVLAFRGTESDSVRDIKTDCRAVIAGCESGGRAHSGFLNAYDTASHAIKNALKEVSDKRLFITGHSLGGALATIAAKKLKHDGGIAACYTFGSPLVGNEDWVVGMKTPVYRVVNAMDVVTVIPPGRELIGAIIWICGRFPFLRWVKPYLQHVDGYMHCGDMKYLSNCHKSLEEVRLLPSTSTFFRLTRIWIKALHYRRFLLDHSIGIYRKKLFIIAKRRNNI